MRKRSRRKRTPITENPPPPPPETTSLPAGPPQPEHEEEAERLLHSHSSERAINHQTPIAVAFRHIRPFWRNYIQYVDLASRSGDDRAKKYVQVWTALTPRERKNHFPEQVCEMAGLMPHELVEMVCGQLFLMETAEAGMVTAFARKEVIQAARYFGTTFSDAYKDRELVAKVSGALPAPKGSSVTVNLPGALASGGGGAPSRLASSGQVLDMDAEIIGLSQVLELPAAKTIPDDEEQDEDDRDEPDDDED